MRVSTITIAIAALLAPLASANALPPLRAGILQCQGGQNVGFVVGSVTSFECLFQSEGRRPEPYIATVRRYGVDRWHDPLPAAHWRGGFRPHQVRSYIGV